MPQQIYKSAAMHVSHAENDCILGWPQIFRGRSDLGMTLVVFG